VESGHPKDDNQSGLIAKKRLCKKFLPFRELFAFEIDACYACIMLHPDNA
jgi:hypothetical protein